MSRPRFEKRGRRTRLTSGTRILSSLQPYIQRGDRSPPPFYSKRLFFTVKKQLRPFRGRHLKMEKGRTAIFVHACTPFTLCNINLAVSRGLQPTSQQANKSDQNTNPVFPVEPSGDITGSAETNAPLSAFGPRDQIVSFSGMAASEVGPCKRDGRPWEFADVQRPGHTVQCSPQAQR